MKNVSRFAALFPMILLVSCASMVEPKIGMSFKHWARTTLIADLVYMDGDVKAYRSGGAYYYFVDDKLARIDQGRLPAQEIRLTIQREAPVAR